MFRKTTLHLMVTAAITTTATTIALPIHAQQTGVIRGTVTDESGDYRFSDALVSIPDESRSAITDRSGRFRLDDLPAGEYRIRVTYQGGMAQDVTVVLDEGETENLAIKVDRANDRSMPEVLVRGHVAGQLSALNRRRNAESLIDVLSSDSVGQFPDQNLAEALQRATGMSVQRDQGEGRFVVIRGIDPKFNSTTINGLRIPGPEADSRAVNLDVISSDLIETVEISKAVTPDMDGDAVGGNIEIKTLTAFDLPAGFAKVTAGGSYNATNEEISPDIAGTYTNVFSLGAGMDNLGVAFSFSRFDRKTVSDGIEGSAWPLEESPDGQEYRMLEEGEQRDYILTRDRTSLALNFDYRPSDDTDLYLRTLYSEFDDYETKLENIYIFEEGDIESLNADGGRFTGAEMEKANADSNKVQTITSVSLGGQTRLQDWTVDYSLGHSIAGEEGAISEIGGVFIAEDVDIGYDATDPRRPRLYGFGDQAILDPSAFALDEAESEDVFNEERETALELNFRRDMDFGSHPGYVKFGAKSRFREKENDTELTLYEGFGDDYTLSDFLQTGMDYPLPGDLGPGVDFRRFRNFVETNGASFEINDEDSLIDSRAEDYELEENIHAAYLMAGADVGSLNLVGGLRAEHTNYEAVGTRVSIDEQNTDGNPVLEPFSGSKSYTDFFPSLAFRYQASDQTQWRAAVTRTISRPGFEDASPRQALEISEDDDGSFEREAEIGNPDLEPLTSNNLDFRWEHYPTGVSSLSAGAFYKDINSFFVTANTAGEAPFENFDEVIQTLNGGSASLYGIELEYYQQLDWLPAPFNALLVGTNYTYSNSEADLPERARKGRLPGQSDHIGNLSFGYDDGRLSARVAATYRSEFFEEVNEIDDPSGDRYQDSHLQVDFTGRLRLSESLELYLNMINLNDEPLYAYFGEPRFVSQHETYGRTYEAGFTLQF